MELQIPLHIMTTVNTPAFNTAVPATEKAAEGLPAA